MRWVFGVVLARGSAMDASQHWASRVGVDHEVGKEVDKQAKQLDRASSAGEVRRLAKETGAQRAGFAERIALLRRAGRQAHEWAEVYWLSRHSTERSL